jgi:hypothetical protein
MTLEQIMPESGVALKPRLSIKAPTNDGGRYGLAVI